MQGPWIYIIWTLSIFTTLLLVWMELRRANKRFVALRAAAVTLAVAALICVILPLKYNGVKINNSARPAILLTQGFERDSLPATADSDMLTIDPAIKQANPNVKLVNSIDEIESNGRLDVYGSGLSADELSGLNDLPLAFHPSKVLDGISTISWNQKVKAGEPIRIQGNYNNTSAKRIKLVLKGLNTAVDSVTVPPKATTSFELSALPKAPGKQVFALHADTAFIGSVPVQVEAAKPLKVLMLSASPGFETRFLKNWLSQNGYAVAIRSAISKDKYNSEYLNMEQVELSKLSAQTLDKFDVVMGDLSVLSMLSADESNRLKQQVADKGLGLIVSADSAGKASWLQRLFIVDRPSGKEPSPGAIIINGKRSASARLATTAANLLDRDGAQIMVTANQRTVAAGTIYGSGKIIFTTLNNTFSWMLGGNKDDYTRFWSALISKAARKTGEVNDGIQFASLPVVTQPVLMQLQGARPVSINNEWAPPEQNTNIPFYWNATYRPAASGWQTARLGSQTVNWYAYRPAEWQSLRSAERMEATARYASQHRGTSIVTKQIQQKIRIDVPKIYFYILLLAACTFLWVENKMP